MLTRLKRMIGYVVVLTAISYGMCGLTFYAVGNYWSATIIIGLTNVLAALMASFRMVAERGPSVHSDALDQGFGLGTIMFIGQFLYVIPQLKVINGYPSFCITYFVCAIILVTTWVGVAWACTLGESFHEAFFKTKNAVID